MTTQTLKLNKFNTNIVNNNNLEKRVFNTILSIIVFLVLCYILLLGNIVWNIVARKNLEVNARNLSTEVSSLELNYLSLSNKIDLNLAQSLGFKDVTKVYTSRQKLGSLAKLSNEL
ncbi:MAG: hypothetical protein NTZ44_04145 [Candidatus Nomurabacteria bacterium]|nr:hypothetical protein [Candidatus Nomurabacteria bacterium]